ncbi:MAG: hypothetical protein ACJAV1_002882, partial [Paraglaciecola sp.]
YGSLYRYLYQEILSNCATSRKSRVEDTEAATSSSLPDLPSQ